MGQMNKLTIRLKPKVARDIKVIAELEEKPLEKIIMEIIDLGIAEKKRRMLEGLGVRVEKKAE